MREVKNLVMEEFIYRNSILGRNVFSAKATFEINGEVLQVQYEKVIDVPAMEKHIAQLCREQVIGVIGRRFLYCGELEMLKNLEDTLIDCGRPPHHRLGDVIIRVRR